MSARELITEHLDLWTGAVAKKSSSGRGSNGKVELTGVKKLRELVLDLALKGRLSERSIDDQPAEKLIEQFFLHKEKLVKYGELRQQKKLPEITFQEHEYKIPETWQVERLGRLSHQITKGTTPTSIGLSFAEKGVNFVKVESLSDGCIDHTNVQFISKDTHQTLQRSQLQAGDILFSIAGTIGKTAIVQDKDTPANTNQALAIIKGTAEVFTERFLKLQLDSFVSAKAKNKARGGAMNNISLGDLSNLVVLVPPLEEQHRIVQKVDELMALCDRLEQQTSDQLEAHDTLMDTLLGTLTQSGNATELTDNWTRLAAHFDTLFTTEQSIDKLKQTILQLAVMGRLVEQDAGDEPATTLLQSIEGHKAELGKAGFIKRSKPLPPVTAEEHPFKLPANWRCHRLGELISKLGSGSTPRGGQRAYVEEGVPFLRSQNIWNDGLRLDDIVYISAETHARMSNTVVYPNDILLNITGASLGRSTIFPSQIPEANVSQHVTIIRLIEPAMTPFVHLCIQSPLIQSLVWGRQVGMAIEGLSKKVLERFEMPIPPLEEQHRIVQKVDELMALCDQLKERLNQASETRCQLAETVVEGALN